MRRLAAPGNRPCVLTISGRRKRIAQEPNIKGKWRATVGSRVDINANGGLQSCWPKTQSHALADLLAELGAKICIWTQSRHFGFNHAIFQMGRGPILLDADSI